MKLAVLIAALALLPNLAAAQDKPAAPAAKKGAPKEAPVAKVNGVALPASHLEFLMQQQRTRGAPDNAQTRRHCGSVTGQTERRDWRTRAMSARTGSALICFSVTGRATGLRAATSTMPNRPSASPGSG